MCVFTECILPSDLPALPDHIRATMSKDCSGVDICMLVDRLQRNFNVYMKLDSCSYVMTLRIERHEAEISLQDYEFGTWKEFYLYGVIQIG